MPIYKLISLSIFLFQHDSRAELGHWNAGHSWDMLQYQPCLGHPVHGLGPHAELNLEQIWSVDCIEDKPLVLVAESEWPEKDGKNCTGESLRPILNNVDCVNGTSRQNTLATQEKHKVNCFPLEKWIQGWNGPDKRHYLRHVHKHRQCMVSHSHYLSFTIPFNIAASAAPRKAHHLLTLIEAPYLVN